MRLVAIAAVAPAMLLASASAVIAADSTTKVDVEGQTFRVTKAHGEIIVAAKGFIVRKSPELSRRMHQAVEQVTGCKLANEVWTGNTLRGDLACAEDVR